MPPKTMKKQKLLQKVLAGSKNIRFAEIVALAEAVGFELQRVSGSHHIFLHADLDEMLNLQDVKGEAKAYQVRQLIKLIEKHDLKLREDT